MQAENYYLTWYYGAPAVKLFLHVAVSPFVLGTGWDGPNAGKERLRD